MPSKANFCRDDIDITPADEPSIDRSLSNVRMKQAGLSVPSMEEMLNELKEKCNAYR